VKRPIWGHSFSGRRNSQVEDIHRNGTKIGVYCERKFNNINI
jgi:hypothetical protein